MVRQRKNTQSTVPACLSILVSASALLPALFQREANACYKHVSLHGVVAAISQKKKAQQLRQDQPG